MTDKPGAEPEWLDRYRKSGRPDHQACARDYDALAERVKELDNELDRVAQEIKDERAAYYRAVTRAESAESRLATLSDAARRLAEAWNAAGYRAQSPWREQGDAAAAEIERSGG